MSIYPAIKPIRLTGDERLTAEDAQVSTLLDFWRWAYSDLVGNTERGALAEYIVACALGINHNIRISWDRYDLLSPEGISVEVKASGYIQTWEQDKLSSISFGIGTMAVYLHQTVCGSSVRRTKMILRRLASTCWRWLRSSEMKASSTS